MATIDNITRTDGGWKFTFDASGIDIWLDGELLESNYDDTTYEFYSHASCPPDIEICAHGERCTNSWAGRRMTLQWCADTHTSYAITEYRSGTAYSTDYYDVPPGVLYANVTVTMAETDNTAQYWTVRPCEKHDDGSYSIAGMPIQTTVRRHYLPPAPQVAYSYSAATGLITISAKRRGML